MAARKKSKRALRYTPEQKVGIVKRLEKHSLSAVSDMSGVSVNTLRVWADAAGVTPPDGRRSQPPPPKATPSVAVNGHAKRKATELELRGLRDFLREEVRVLLPAVVRQELAAARGPRS